MGHFCFQKWAKDHKKWAKKSFSRVLFTISSQKMSHSPEKTVHSPLFKMFLSHRDKHESRRISAPNASCFLIHKRDSALYPEAGKIATKIVRGLSVLGLKGCGPKLVTKAVKEFYIRDIIDWVNTFGSRDQHVLDLLKQKDFKPNEIKNLTSITSVLHDGSTITNILASVCIPKCNTEFVNKVENECGGIQHLMQICPVDRMYDEIVNKCKADAVRNFMIWIENNHERFMQYMSAFRILSTSNPTGISGTVCFTGTGPKPRKELQILAMNNGYQVTENANQCTILVAADVGGNSTKLQKAKSKGIKVISYEEFLETLRG